MSLVPHENVNDLESLVQALASGDRSRLALGLALFVSRIAPHVFEIA